MPQLPQPPFKPTQKANFLLCRENLKIKVYNHKIIKSNILDLIFYKSNIEIKSPTKPLVKVDIFHVPLEIKLKTESIYNKVEKTMFFNYKKANYENIYKKLSLIDWDNNLNNIDININVKFFYDSLNSIIQDEVPKTLLIKDKFPKFFSKKLKRLTKIKKIYHKQYKKTKKKKYYYYRKFNKQRKYCKYIYNLEYNEFISKIENDIKTDQKPYWSYLDNKKKNEIPLDMHYNDKTYENDHEILNNFADFFHSTYSNTKIDSCSNPMIVTENEMNLECITDKEILNAIKRIKTNQSPGYDNIHPLFVKNCMHYLISPLKVLFNQSLIQSKLPDLWKIGLIIPIFKKGDIKNIKNYRPITILSCFAKLLDHLIYNRLSSFFNNKIITEQHGSINKRSTITNLLTFKEYISQAFNRGNQVHVLYTDVSKAFDSVNHELIIQKLKNYKVNAKIVSWLNSYLCNRKQLVKIDHKLSKEIVPSSGVPQGSNLGPLLYIIYTNDLKKVINNSKFLIYVDDLKIFREITSKKDIKLFKSDIMRLHNWNYLNGLKWNFDKCNIMVFDKWKTKNNYEVEYKIGKHKIKQISVIKDLGIYFEDNLNFNVHIDNIISQSKKRIYF